MNQVAKIEDENQVTGFLQVIERVAMSKDVDVSKLEKMLDMQERILAKQAETSFNQAMSRLQPRLPIIQHDAEIKHGEKLISSYSRYESIDKLIRPIYTSEGFSLSFNSKKQPDGSVTYYGTLSHIDGHSRTAEMDLPADSSGAKNAIQAKGSTISYAKRYLVSMLLNLVTTGDDDDAEKGGAEFINESQLSEIQNLIDETAADTRKFCEYMKVKSLADIKSKDHQKALNALRAKAKQK